MPEKSVASVLSGGSFWKGLVIEGLHILRSVVHLNGEQSAAWDTVVGIIEAL